MSEDVQTPKVSIDFETDILYVDSQIGLRVRKTPEVADNKIETLPFGKEVKVIEKKEDWFKINYDGKEGWVCSQFLSEENPKISTSEVKKQLSEDFPVFEIGCANLVSDENTKRVRKIINDEFTGGRNSWSFQCVEYVHFRIKINQKVNIAWPSDRPRHGGLWAAIFQKNNQYKVLDEPKEGCAVSFSNPNFNAPYGHVAYIEKVFSDQSIRISEANWPSNGVYNERILSKEQWKNPKWTIRFIDFT